MRERDLARVEGRGRTRRRGRQDRGVIWFRDAPTSSHQASRLTPRTIGGPTSVYSPASIYDTVLRLFPTSSWAGGTYTRPGRTM